MKTYAFDVETTTFEKGNPFSKKNKLVLLGIYNNEDGESFDFKDCELLVGFNIKFDLHWLKRTHGDIFFGKVWDVQLAHFYLTGQKNPYPSLNEVSDYYGHGQKLDVVKTEYWDKGIDTDQIPIKVLKEYLTEDLILTWKCYESQKEEFKQFPKLYRLFLLGCRDLQVLQEMEYNGLCFNESLANERAEVLTKEINEVLLELKNVYPNIPVDFNSVDHLSAFLYGGNIEEERRISVGVFKTGEKAGQPRFKVDRIQHACPRICEPPKGSALKKEGYWSTDDKSLRKIKANKKVQRILDLISTYRKKSKLLNTYYQGWLDMRQKMDWNEGEIHGQLNQCVVPTGRLASAKPNLQNLPEEVSDLFRSWYD